MSIMHSTYVAVLVIVLVFWSTYSNSLPFTGSCDSCGKECMSACGTRSFRTCCLNYLKKRSTPMSTGSEMRLELMMVLPELVQHYPSLRNLIPDIPDDGGSLKRFFEKPEIDKIKFSKQD